MAINDNKSDVSVHKTGPKWMVHESEYFVLDLFFKAIIWLL